MSTDHPNQENASRARVQDSESRPPLHQMLRALGRLLGRPPRTLQPYRADPMAGAVILSVLVIVVLAGIGEAPPASMAPVTIRMDESPEEFFLLLDGMPEKAARRLPTYRDQLNPRMPPEDLRRVPGLGSSLIHPWWPWFTSPPRPFDDAPQSPQVSPNGR
jgi:hypothetical protein